MDVIFFLPYTDSSADSFSIKESLSAPVFLSNSCKGEVYTSSHQMKLPLGRSPEPDYLERYHKSWEHEDV